LADDECVDANKLTKLRMKLYFNSKILTPTANIGLTFGSGSGSAITSYTCATFPDT
jgi:hypothetical protein